MEVQAPFDKQMGYDRAIVMFSPEGRMYQVEYARKAAERATTAVGVTFKEGVILIASKMVQKLLIPESVEKIYKIDEHIGAVACGILGDARVLVDFARIRAQVNRITFDEPIEIAALVKEISDRQQRFTQMGGIRPYGVNMLIAGTDGMSHLYETDPSGTLREWKAHAIGRGTKEARKFLVDNFKEGMNRDEALDIAMKALKEGEKKLPHNAVEIGLVENRKFKMMDRNEVKKLSKSSV